MILLVKPAELLLRGINRVRRGLYRRGLLRARRLPKPVVSVGNVTFGGAGKTPATIAIANFLIARGYRVCVLTRGYGRAGAGGRVTSLDAAEFGDEPVLIKKHAPKADVIVGSNRYENGISVNCDVYLLDDGFQHLQLHRDVDIVIDVPSPRLLREGPSAMQDADIILRRDLRLLVPEGLRGQRLFAFSGLADNEQFFASLRAAGLEVAGTRGFADHHRYAPADLAAIRAGARAAGADAIVTTEKDAVKLGDGEIIAIPAELAIDPRDLERIAKMIT
ncbi:MAG: lpxK [Acidobacteria bacterium]|nr:lpxK [Acidobacteriota bacterium]